MATEPFNQCDTMLMIPTAEYALLKKLAPTGFYIALHVGFYAPAREVNTFPEAWVHSYTKSAMAMDDPYMRWTQTGDGIRTWSSLAGERTRAVEQAYHDFGFHFGATASIPLTNDGKTRSYGLFSRSGKEFAPDELITILRILRDLHTGDASTLTEAQVEVLRMMANGHSQKVISHELGVSMSAIKERLKSAGRRLGTGTTLQTLTVATERGLI